MINGENIQDVFTETMTDSFTLERTYKRLEKKPASPLQHIEFEKSKAARSSSQTSQHIL